jgi:hypothetical protein
MRTILATTLILVTTVTPAAALARQLAVGDEISIRPFATAATQGGWGQQDLPTPVRPAWAEARVVRHANDTLWYSMAGTGGAVATEQIEIRRSTGKNHRWSGAVLGGVVLGTIGALVGYANPASEHTPGFMCFVDCEFREAQSRGQGAWTGALLGAGVGALLGDQIGRRIPKWEAVELTPSVPEAGLVGLNLRVGF